MFSRASNILLPIAVDVGFGAVKMMQLQVVNDRLRVRAAWKTNFPLTLRREEERQEFAVDAIRGALKGQRFKGRLAVTVVPNHAVQFKSFRIPKMPPEEIASAVLFEAEERFAFQSEDAEYRYLDSGHIRQGQETRHEIIAMGCTGEALRNHMELFKKTGMVCTATDVAPCAVVRCLEDDAPASEAEGQARMYADIGIHTTRIITTLDGRIVFIKSIAVGGQALNELTAKGLNLSLAEATQLRREILMSTPEPESDIATHTDREVLEAANAAIRPGAEQLGKEISLCLRYYAVTFRGVRPSHLICVGGQSYDRQLLQTISEITGVQAVQGAPLKRIEDGKVFTEAQRRSGLLEWTTAVGLSLRSRDELEARKEAS